ncbi:conserved hypothetical protein [Leishmania mexicana MHOM/GT/2001/U1103]|uniref:Uncharacterized protein n=1 Tax=Leishmania mexicana (strain MHOM/GT/2001/U1103) TaxID=929439 RepID=E9AXH2_LEIMU|nr:conserved hypothetical protein [Leishmania mexicana MHOM/GT/2001/U1103]CBZ27663.1 conserved hypothetical protein [Leishmania mexicana MHOM/GT/2001/U1103]
MPTHPPHAPIGDGGHAHTCTHTKGYPLCFLLSPKPCVHPGLSTCLYTLPLSPANHFVLALLPPSPLIPADHSRYASWQACMEEDTVSNEGSVGEVDRESIASPLPFLSGAMPGQQTTTAAAAAAELDATIGAPIDAPDDIDSPAEESASTTHSPSTMTTASTSATGSKAKGNTRSKKKRGATAPLGTAGRKMRPGPTEESTLVAAMTAHSAEHGITGTHSDSQDESDGLSKPSDATRRGGERSEQNLPAVESVLTRRPKSEKADDPAAPQQEKPRRDGASDTAASKLEGSENLLDDARLHEARSSRSRSHSTAPHTPTVLNPASASSLSPLGAKQEEEEAWEAAVQAAIEAQERQLRHTLLSVFPPELLRGVEWERCLDKERDLRSGTKAGGARNVKDAPSQPVGTAPTPFPSSSLSHRLSPEPLLPLLKALCEDKAYVHGAWCRYEDDLAVRRTQNSIQRKRQRYSFSKGGRKGSSSGPTAAARRRDGDGGDNDDSNADEDKAPDEDELQPPESHWVEVPPAFTGGPRPLPTSATHLAPDSAVMGGFQWAPWRFYREKRRRSSRRPTVGGASPASARSSTAVSAVQPDLFSAASSNAPVSSGGVPSLACSEVPSLPVLQVEAHVPESAAAVVSPMTPEERKGYARYVMSSGKLRHDCRDPYAFLISRAKEMRIQWKRQHPMD